MRSFLKSLLFVAVTFVYVLGSRAVVIFEHSHEMAESHSHHHTNDDSGNGGHSHGHGHETPSEGQEPGGEPDSHSHVVALGVDVPFVASGFADVRAVAWTDTGLSLPDADKLPESPCFPLIMPPQLG
jgi:hypothetical protein